MAAAEQEGGNFVILTLAFYRTQQLSPHAAYAALVSFCGLKTGHHNTNTIKPLNEVEMHKRRAFLCDRFPVARGHAWRAVWLAHGGQAMGKKHSSLPEDPRGRHGVWEAGVSEETTNT